MSQSSRGKPAYVTELEAAYGAPSQAGFGSAVFFEPQITLGDFENAAKEKYKHFVGKLWQGCGESVWMGAWKQVYARETGSKHDVVAELRGVKDAEAQFSIPMILDNIDNAEAARMALSDAFDDPATSQFAAYTLGDGEAMSGIMVAGGRDDGEATFLVFLLD